MSLSYFDVWLNLSNPLQWRKLSLSVPTIEGLSPEGIPAVYIDYNNSICLVYVCEYEEDDTVKYKVEFIYSRTMGATWSEPIEVIKDVDLHNPSILVDNNNRIWVFYFKGDKPYQCFTSNFKDFTNHSEITEA